MTDCAAAASCCHGNGTDIQRKLQPGWVRPSTNAESGPCFVSSASSPKLPDSEVMSAIHQHLHTDVVPSHLGKHQSREVEFRWYPECTWWREVLRKSVCLWSLCLPSQVLQGDGLWCPTATCESHLLLYCVGNNKNPRPRLRALGRLQHLAGIQ